MLDGENFVFKYTVIEGGYLGAKIISYSFEIVFAAGDNGGTNGKLTLSYETSDDEPLAEGVKQSLVFGSLETIKALEGYLIANPGAYA